MLKQIIDFLESVGFVSDLDKEDTYTKTITVPGRTIVINGQETKEPDRDMHIGIKYVGEGSFWDVGEEAKPMWGFRFGNDDIWAQDLDDFKWWFNAFLGKVIPCDKIKRAKDTNEQ